MPQDIFSREGRKGREVGTKPILGSLRYLL